MSTSANRILRTGAVIALALGGLVTQAARADNLNPIVGAGIGALAGAAIGQSMGGRDGAMVGAAIGGVAGVGIATQGQRRGGGYYQQPQAVVYPAPPVVYQAPPPVYAAPVYVPAPSYGYRVVERVNYYPAPVYEYRGGPGPRWERHDGWDRQEGWDHHDHGNHRGWDRRD